MKKILSKLMLLLVMGLLLNYTLAVNAKVDYTPADILHYKLDGKLNTPDKNCFCLAIQYIKNNLYVKIEDKIYKAEDLTISAPDSIEFCLNTAGNKATKLKFNGKIIENFSMGGTVYDLTGQKGFWWVKISDKQLRLLNRKLENSE